jgi:hypothetical protein
MLDYPFRSNPNVVLNNTWVYLMESIVPILVIKVLLFSKLSFTITMVMS